uniref:Zinc knuckle CX2CX4HX4C domain-containing protein n=1 Tax=Fagus sylvatica TaxID=28930 RepID=A0A2N9IYG3_FAGSY
MRIRVRVDITKPLCRGRRIGLTNGGEGWVSFRYERLPNFCYWCGIPTHGEKDYEEWLKTGDEEKEKTREYGVWLKASQDRVIRRVQVKVEGRARGAGATMGNKRPVPQPSSTPRRAAPAQSPLMESDPTDMETTEYPEGDILAADILAQNHATFDDQLREIDLAINYSLVSPIISETAGKNKSMRQVDGLGPKSPMQIKKASPPTKDPRSPLGEITNNSPTSNQKPNGGKWKKLAYAKGQGLHDSRTFIVAEKRTCETAFQVEEMETRGTKNARVAVNELLSAEAGVQPRRAQ